MSVVKIVSASLYPTNLVVPGLCLNKTPEGVYQVIRLTGAGEGEVLFESLSASDAIEFAEGPYLDRRVPGLRVQGT